MFRKRDPFPDWAALHFKPSHYVLSRQPYLNLSLILPIPISHEKGEWWAREQQENGFIHDMQKSNAKKETSDVTDFKTLSWSLNSYLQMWNMSPPGHQLCSLWVSPPLTCDTSTRHTHRFNTLHSQQHRTGFPSSYRDCCQSLSTVSSPWAHLLMFTFYAV